MNQRTALITGASAGIGLAAARRLADSGFRLALVARDQARLAATAATLPAETITLPADLESPAEAQAIIDRCIARTGRLDALINNAGWSPSATIPQTTPEITARVFALNAIAPTLSIARAWPIFERQFAASGVGGVVVNVSSMATVDPYPILYAYAAAKSSVNSLARSVASQGRAIGVRGFAVAPGAVETDLLRSLVPASMLPPSKTLSPDAVAVVITDCVLGARDRDNGTTILLPSP